ncbi:MAG: DUF4440 domain-containing protein [Pseudomonadota bacterium]
MDDSDSAHIIALEKQLLHSEIRASRESLNALLCDEFVEFGKSGKVFDKADILRTLPEEKPASFNMTDTKCVTLSNETVLLTYRVSRQGITSLRSSIWRREAGRWRLLFHQGTPSPE